MNVNIPTITTARLILRPFAEADVDPLHHILSQPDVLRYFPKPDPPSRERVQKLIANQLKQWEERGYAWWAVEQRSHPGLMGWAGLQFLPETDETEVGYLLGKPYWGQGFATEAALASLQFGFATLGLERVIGIVHPQNKASIRVMEKIGMSFVDHNNYFGMEVVRYSMTAPKKDAHETL